MKVFFNASVILAGVRSPSGASGELLKRVKAGEIKGVISELIVNEVARHADKAGFGRSEMERKIEEIFILISEAPEAEAVKKYQSKVLDPDDSHVLASAMREKCQILVTLDKKHLLVLARKMKDIQIFSPGQYLMTLRQLR
ncbi:MAG: Uncharacterized protein G01um101416_170 [Microgenomates group bacterium Gr01-1014_16]|nr:MAG: Uncharacterized protein G01um101416_170 [Microgenomates group bacterium Gr01-1014_16]